MPLRAPTAFQAALVPDQVTLHWSLHWSEVYRHHYVSSGSLPDHDSRGSHLLDYLGQFKLRFSGRILGLPRLDGVSQFAKRRRHVHSVYLLVHTWSLLASISGSPRKLWS